MKRFLPVAFASLLASPLAASDATPDIITVYDGAVFYDGYLMEKNPDKEIEDGITRHSCSLYSRPLTDDQLDRIGENLKLHVDVQALCDNYDRIGNVNIAFVPKGESSYDPDFTQRIEIGRFITPFMNMNKEPDTVPYEYDVEYLSPLLRDSGIRARYDLWLELEIFGIPYAANQQVAGCAGRNDVFKGFLHLATSEPAPAVDNTVILPIIMKKPEYKGHNLNNYSEAGTDTIGMTTKTYTKDLPDDVRNARIVLITSNHGANAGGEEYSRRQHYIYLDDALTLSYIPGRESCEPFREYNTQGNGIYGSRPKSDAQWQSFSNWCPGDVIDNRQILLDHMHKGIHKIRISVPEARFVDKQGDIPVSMYLIGEKTDLSGVSQTPAQSVFSIKNDGSSLRISSTKDICGLEILNAAGLPILSTDLSEPVSTLDLPIPSGLSGIHLVTLRLSDGVSYTRKLIL